MTVNELIAHLQQYESDTGVIVTVPHCCGEGPDFETLEVGDITLIPKEGRRRSGFSPMAMSYGALGIASKVDDKEFAGCVLIGTPE